MTIVGTVAGFTSNEGGFSDIRASEDLTVAATVDVSGATRFRGGGFVSAGSLVVNAQNVVIAGSQFGVAVLYAAGNNITGGMWVSNISGLANVVQSAAASESGTIGVATTTTASGGTVPVLVYGIISMTADAACSPGDKVVVGAGTARNTVASVGSPYSAQETFAVVGRALNAAASGAAVNIVLGI